MLKVLKLEGKSTQHEHIEINVYNDEDLHNFDFSGFDDIKSNRLTKYRLVNQSGSSISFEIKKGRIIGIELLYVDLKQTCDVCSFINLTETVEELPIHTFELDGTNTNCSIDIFTIEQCSQFEIRVSPYKDKIEIVFDKVYTASKYGCVTVYYNENQQLSGIKLANLNLK